MYSTYIYDTVILILLEACRRLFYYHRDRVSYLSLKGTRTIRSAVVEGLVISFVNYPLSRSIYICMYVCIYIDPMLRWGGEVGRGCFCCDYHDPASGPPCIAASKCRLIRLLKLFAITPSFLDVNISDMKRCIY